MPIENIFHEHRNLFPWASEFSAMPIEIGDLCLTYFFLPTREAFQSPWIMFRQSL